MRELELNLVTRGSGNLSARQPALSDSSGRPALAVSGAGACADRDDQGLRHAGSRVFKRQTVKRTARDVAERALLQAESGEKACRRLSQQDLKRMETLFEEVAAAKDRVSLLNAGLSYALLAAWRALLRARGGG